MKIKRKKININLNEKGSKLFSKAKEVFSVVTNIPDYVVDKVTKITMINNNLLIEGYKAVDEYNENYIKITAIDMEIVIDGKDLDISEINDEDIIIKGKIYSLNFRK